MNPRILKELLQDLRVQALIKIAIELKEYTPEEVSTKNIIRLIRQELQQPEKEGPSWRQLEFKL